MRNRINPTVKLLLLSLGVAVTTTLLLLSGQRLHSQLQPNDVAVPDIRPEHSHQDPSGKPGAAVRFIGPMTANLTLHEQRTLHISLAVEADQVVTVDVQVDNGLTLASAQNQWEFGPATAVLDLPLDVYAAARGTHFVHIFVTTEDRHGQRASRAMAMQVKVDAEEAAQMNYKSAARQVSSPAFISLPVTETIH